MGIVLIVKVELRQPASRLAEGDELFGTLHDGDAGKGFAEVVGKALAIVGTVEQTIDVVEDVFFGEALCPGKSAAHLL